jgi:hypothetical protein
MDNKYQNSKIYKVVDVGYHKCYIGSTCEELSQRMARHRQSYKGFLKGLASHVRCYDLFDEFGYENCKIELIEHYPCDDRYELRRREGYHIQNNECVNKAIAGRTKKEYTEQTKEKKIDYDKQYRENNKEKKKEHDKEYRLVNAERIKEKKKEYRMKNKEKIREHDRMYRELNKETLASKQKEKYEKNREYYIERAKHNYELNKLK